MNTIKTSILQVEYRCLSVLSIWWGHWHSDSRLFRINYASSWTTDSSYKIFRLYWEAIVHLWWNKISGINGSFTFDRRNWFSNRTVVNILIKKDRHFNEFQPIINEIHDLGTLLLIADFRYTPKEWKCILLIYWLHMLGDNLSHRHMVGRRSLKDWPCYC